MTKSNSSQFGKLVHPERTPNDMTTEEKLETMAREDRLPAELVPLWEDAKSSRQDILRGTLHEVELILKREVVMGEAELVATILWIAHTYVYGSFKLSPRLFITSVSPGSGKTTLLTLIEEMSFGGRRYNKLSIAALGRLKDEYGSKLTVALDQLDNALDLGATETGLMLDRLISGADRNSKQVLVEKIDGRNVPVEYDFSYPMALGKVGSLPSEALLSRCILIQMHPATPEEAEQLVARAKERAEPNIRPLLTKFWGPLGPALAAARPALPANLINRGADKWRPLLAIAEAAGGDWPERALAAADQLESYEAEPPPHVTLLRKLVAITKDWPHEVIFSEELDRALDRAEMFENTGSARARHRARILRQVGLKPERHWRGDKQARGYRIADIRKAAEKYIVPDTCDG